MIRNSLLGLILFLCSTISAQVYDDYIGAGHDDGIIVTTSSEYQKENWDEVAEGRRTLDGSGMDAELMAASRFLAQASFGGSMQKVEQVAEMGYENWLNWQFSLPRSSFLDADRAIFEEGLQNYLENGGTEEVYGNNSAMHFMYTWWQINMTAEDVLRQRVALALSEILVVSFNSDLVSFGEGVSSYYDLFEKHAFGNYRDLLLDVALHPVMGYYLSHFDNPKAIPEENIHSDENFAREIMQLFSIGLYELNQDGSRVTDDEGNPIPTYDNSDIKEMAKIFTGLGAGAVIENEWTDTPEFGYGIWVADMTVPMAMYEEWHQQGEKHLLNGFVVPAGQTGMEDVEMAVNHLFNHPNVGPFIALRLIQRLVTSNPSPEYISRVAAAFNDDGNGVRGNMKAVISTILLDDEARNCDTGVAKLREPMNRYFDFALSMDKNSPNGSFWNIGWSFYENTGQAPLFAPSVFNFFLPEYQPNGEITDEGLVAPEFQIHNSRTSLGYMNSVYDWTFYDYLLWSWEEGRPPVYTDIARLVPMTRDPEVIINHLDILFTHGRLSERTRGIIRNALDAFNEEEPYNYYDKVMIALYLIMISPDYVILK